MHSRPGCPLIVAALALGVTASAPAQHTVGDPALDVTGESQPVFRSGFQDVPQFGGPSSVGAELKSDDEVKETLYRFDGLQHHLKPYFDWKAKVNEKYGLAFGLDYTPLYQYAIRSAGEDQAAGGIWRTFGTWTVFGRESGNTGSLVFKVEHRHKLGTDIPPSSLGFSAGYAGLTAAPFNDAGFAVTNLFWQQRLLEGRVTVVGGVVDATDYVDVYGLINPWTSFSNLAFLTNPAIPVPNQGLGGAVGAMLTDNLYVIGGLADTNGDPYNFGDNFDSFFSDSEFFKHIELGWTTSKDLIYLDNVHMTAWHADQRDKAGIPEGWGIAFSAAKFIDEKWLPFLRAGYSDDGGALWEYSVSTGVGYYMKRRADLLGFGFNWSRPSATGVGPGLNDQYTMELFYRLQLSPNFAITPDVQLILDPALNPSEDSLWVLGVRARLAL